VLIAGPIMRCVCFLRERLYERNSLSHEHRSTARYAQLLGQETGLPVCPLCEARAAVAAETSRAQ